MKKPDFKLGASKDKLLKRRTAANSDKKSTKSNKNSAKSLHTPGIAALAMRSNIKAPAISGEAVIGQRAISAGNDILGTIGPFRLLFGEAKRLVKNIVLSFKDVKKLIPAIVFAVIWILLILLPRLGFNPLPVKVLSFLTFAQGGVSNSLFRMLGGLVGKGMYAYLVTSLFAPLLKGQNPFKSISGGLKGAFSQYGRPSSAISPLLLGAGLALIFYNFMAGYSSPWKSMAAISAMLLTLRSLGVGGGFLVKFLNSLFYKSTGFDVKSILAGMSAGFALSIPVSAIPYVYICYALGGACIIAAIVLLIVRGSKKEAQKV